LRALYEAVVYKRDGFAFEMSIDQKSEYDRDFKERLGFISDECTNEDY
jgi:hypothetical protein